MPDYGPGTCSRCRFWRFKSSANDTDPGWGICDSAETGADVNVSGASFFRSISSKAKVPRETIDEATEQLDVRMREDFGCRHFEEPAP